LGLLFAEVVGLVIYSLLIAISLPLENAALRFAMLKALNFLRLAAFTRMQRAVALIWILGLQDAFQRWI